LAIVTRIVTHGPFAHCPEPRGKALVPTQQVLRPKLAIVTRIVTHGGRAHAATACARSAARASSKSS
jgi:hypothetical protein